MALVGFGAPRPKLMVVGAAVLLRVAVSVTLAADHRVSDGCRRALFLAEIDRLLQEPLIRFEVNDMLTRARGSLLMIAVICFSDD